jgi:hypothetical protein
MQRIASLVAAAAATLLASAALAQMTRSVNDAQFETIVSVSPDASAMIVQDAAGQQRTILLNQGTSITREGRPGTTATTIRVGDIGVGDRILIDGAARQGGFTANRVQVFGPGVTGTPPAGVVTPGSSPGGTPGVSAPGTANPAAPPTGTGAPDGSNPASPPPGTVRPGDPNTAAPGGSPANPASPPGPTPANPAAPPTGGGGGGAAPF